MSADQSRPKLLYVVDPPLSIMGGVSVLVQILIREFSKTHEVYLLSRDQPDFLATHEVNNHLSGHLKWDPPKGPPRLEFLRYIGAVANQICNLNIEIAHFHSGFFNFGNRFFGFSLSRQLFKRGVPSIWTTHGSISLLKGYCGGNKPKWLKYLMFPSGWLGKFSQVLNTEREILVSRFDLSTMRRVWWPVASKCDYLYHSKLDACDVNTAVRKKFILNVGYISFVKRQDLLVHAFLELADDFPDWELYLVGHDTPDGCRGYIDKLIGFSPARDRIHFMGSRNDISEFMQNCGVYVSASDSEGLPLAPQEAMHHGCPIIASDIPAHKELFSRSGSGVLFRQGDANDLATQLARLLADSELRDSLGQAAKAAVVESGMTRSAMLEKHAELYQRILNRKL